jgi:hypothetical protein
MKPRLRSSSSATANIQRNACSQGMPVSVGHDISPCRSSATVGNCRAGLTLPACEGAVEQTGTSPRYPARSPQCREFISRTRSAMDRLMFLRAEIVPIQNALVERPQLILNRPLRARRLIGLRRIRIRGKGGRGVGAMPSQFGQGRGSSGKTAPKVATSTTLGLSIGATRAASRIVP